MPLQSTDKLLVMRKQKMNVKTDSDPKNSMQRLLCCVLNSFIFANILSNLILLQNKNG